MKKRKAVCIGVALILLLCIGIFSPFGKKVSHEAGRQLHTFLDTLEAETSPEQEIDFAYWKNKNPDIYAWLRVDGTDIDYPIVQNEVDDYYLHHDIEKESNIYGAIYTERQNSKDFNDAHTVIYGHNMRDGSMFGSLKDFAKPDFFETHDTFTVFLPEEARQYRIVAAYRYPAEHLLLAFDFSTREGADAYFQAIPAFVQDTAGCLREGSSIQAPLVTLSTCTPDDTSMRYLVQGILIETIAKEENSVR